MRNPKRNDHHENLSENTILPPKAKKAGPQGLKEVGLHRKASNPLPRRVTKKKPCRGNLIENRSKLSQSRSKYPSGAPKL
jgi:hypothetical protein